jgi:hypothetical protein
MFHKTTLVVGSIILLFGLGAIFLGLNFQAAKSITKADQQTSTYSTGFEKGESLVADGPLSLVIEEADGLSKMLGRQMEGNLLNGAQTEIIREPEVRTDINHIQVVVHLKNSG